MQRTPLRMANKRNRTLTMRIPRSLRSSGVAVRGRQCVAGTCSDTTTSVGGCPWVGTVKRVPQRGHSAVSPASATAKASDLPQPGHVTSRCMESAFSLTANELQSIRLAFSRTYKSCVELFRFREGSDALQNQSNLRRDDRQFIDWLSGCHLALSGVIMPAEQDAVIVHRRQHLGTPPRSQLTGMEFSQA